MTKISIIIPVYNEAKTVKDILDRVKNSSVSLEKEIIVVDDGSTDQTVKEVERQIKVKDGFKLIKSY